MSYVVGAFALAAVFVAVLLLPGLRMAAGFAMIIGGILLTMFAMFFGPPVIALGVLVVIIEFYTHRGTSPTPPI